MECMGRMAEILLCILCLTLVPAGNILRTYKKREQNHIEVQVEEFYGKVQRGKRLQKMDYEHFKKLFASCPEYDYELTIARRYVLPAGNADSAKNGLPVKILYRMELEEEFCLAEEIILEGIFINIFVYGKDGYFYTCGGEIW